MSGLVVRTSGMVRVMFMQRCKTLANVGRGHCPQEYIDALYAWPELENLSRFRFRCSMLSGIS